MALERFVSRGLGNVAEFLHALVEGGPVATGVREQALEAGLQVVVGRNQHEPGVVEGHGHCGVVAAVAELIPTAPVGLAHFLEDGRLQLPLGGVWYGFLVERSKAAAPMPQEGGIRDPRGQTGLVGGHVAVVPAKPEHRSPVADECREGLVERGVALDVDDAVREFVEDEVREIALVVVQKRREDRIVEPAEGGVGRHGRDVDVVVRPQARGLALGRLSREVAPIDGATDDGVATREGRHIEFRGGDHVPKRYAVGLDEGGVAVAHGQRQFGFGEMQHRGDQAQLLRHGGLCCRIVGYGRRIAPGKHQRRLPDGRLRVEPHGRAAAERHEQGRRGQSDADAGQS